jgi:hypothetical protein
LRKEFIEFKAFPLGACVTVKGNEISIGGWPVKPLERKSKRGEAKTCEYL